MRIRQIARPASSCSISAAVSRLSAEIGFRDGQEFLGSDHLRRLMIVFQRINQTRPYSPCRFSSPGNTVMLRLARRYPLLFPVMNRKMGALNALLCAIDNRMSAPLAAQTRKSSSAAASAISGRLWVCATCTKSSILNVPLHAVV